MFSQLFNYCLLAWLCIMLGVPLQLNSVAHCTSGDQHLLTEG